jgi:hypothetical protein
LAGPSHHADAAVSGGSDGFYSTDRNVTSTTAPTTTTSLQEAESHHYPHPDEEYGHQHQEAESFHHQQQQQQWSTSGETAVQQMHEAQAPSPYHRQHRGREDHHYQLENPFPSDRYPSGYYHDEIARYQAASSGGGGSSGGDAAYYAGWLMNWTGGGGPVDSTNSSSMDVSSPRPPSISRQQQQQRHQHHHEAPPPPPPAQQQYSSTSPYHPHVGMPLPLSQLSSHAAMEYGYAPPPPLYYPFGATAVGAPPQTSSSGAIVAPNIPTSSYAVPFSGYHCETTPSSMTEPHSSFVDVKRRRAKTFAEKLMNAILENPNEDAIAWLPDGRSFVIVSPDLFTSEVLDKAFKKAKYASFIRKLHRWGFVRLTSGTGTDCFYHPLFTINDPDLASNVTCTTPQDRQADGGTEDSDKPSLAGVERFIRAKLAAASASKETALGASQRQRTTTTAPTTIPVKTASATSTTTTLASLLQLSVAEQAVQPQQRRREQQQQQNDDLSSLSHDNDPIRPLEVEHYREEMHDAAAYNVNTSAAVGNTTRAEGTVRDLPREVKDDDELR